jgi:predicted DNA-binding transcriptional regulator AlpA
MHDEFLNEKALAQKLSISISLLRKWRRTRQGPPWVKLGRVVRYSAAELVIWLNMRANHSDASDPERLIQRTKVGSKTMISGSAIEEFLNQCAATFQGSEGWHGRQGSGR